MKKSYIVSYRADGVYSELSYYSVYAVSSQEAVEITRYETHCYEVVECFKSVKNWN